MLTNTAVHAVRRDCRRGNWRSDQPLARHPSAASSVDDFGRANTFYDLDVAERSPCDEIGFNRIGTDALYRAGLATTVKHEPRPSAERTSTRWPSKFAACFTMKSPRPRPSVLVSS